MAQSLMTTLAEAPAPTILGPGPALGPVASALPVAAEASTGRDSAAGTNLDRRLIKLMLIELADAGI